MQPDGTGGDESAKRIIRIKNNGSYTKFSISSVSPWHRTPLPYTRGRVSMLLICSHSAGEFMGRLPALSIVSLVDEIQCTRVGFIIVANEYF